MWSPAPSRESKLLVMVWFFGGAWQTGSGGSPVFTESSLPRQGVILVAFNHRVGPLGFLAHPELTQESRDHASGNYGLTDQAAVLHEAKHPGLWRRPRQRHDPRTILRGVRRHQSNGVAAYRGAVPTRHRPEFRRAPHAHMLPLAEAEKQGERFAKGVGAQTLADLRAMPAQEVLRASTAAKTTFFPIVDGWFMPAPVRDMFIEGREHRVPLIIGWNRNEGTTYGFPGLIAAKEPMEKRFGARANDASVVYPASSESETVQSSAMLHADTMFGVPTWTAAREHAKTAKNSAWLYHYEHEQPFFPGQKYLEFDNIPNLGAFHGSEVPYVFGTLHVLPRAWTDTDRQISSLMQTYVLNFAKTGNPNGTGVMTWPAFDKNKDTVLHIAKQPYLGAVPGLKRLEFLDAGARSLP